MNGTLETTLTGASGGATADLALGGLASESARAVASSCYHCGETCPNANWTKQDKSFCCQGCLVVHELLAESGLGQFYDLSLHPGVRIARAQSTERWTVLDDPVVQERFIQFTDDRISRVTFDVPGIHCVACVWLLENLFRLDAGIAGSQVNFARREVTITYDPTKLKLSEVAGLLARIGYEPTLSLGELDKGVKDGTLRKQWLQVGVAGFAFGNIMLMSVPSYLGLDSFSGPTFRVLFGWLSLVLGLPVLLYSASDYWRSALVSFRQRVLTLDVPIALGLAALYGRSAFEIVTGAGEGYLDSMAGLIFFLLCGRAFQQKTHDRIVFDRDYKSFFPLSVTRKHVGAPGQAYSGSIEEIVPISSLRVGDRLILRNREMIPADARLAKGEARVDYSFVTGESEIVRRNESDLLYAGGQQVGGEIEVETIKPVSQSYLTSLWRHETFQKKRDHDLNSLTNRYSRIFTKVVVGIALTAGFFWAFSGDVDRGLKAFTSVLIVACPCALALAAPFTLGTAQRLLARANVFLKNGLVLERMARCDTVVFDKTGTLTVGRGEQARFLSVDARNAARTSRENDDARELGYSLCRLSTHPMAVRIAEDFGKKARALPVEEFEEIAGNGLRGVVADQEVVLGSGRWLETLGMKLPSAKVPGSTVSWVAVNGSVRGAFWWGSGVRVETAHLLEELGTKHRLALLSGDNERERSRFSALFGSGSELRFNQTPLQKLEYIRQLQESGQVVMMVGDGLNDAGALKQSDVGIAVVEKTGAFSPGSDVIVPGLQVPELPRIMMLARHSVRVVRWGLAMSSAYNVVGISIAAAGFLSPLLCAILMPISSLSVVLFASGATSWAARKAGVK